MTYTRNKLSPQISKKKGLATNPKDFIMSSTPRHSFTNNAVTHKYLAKIGPRGEVAICELLPNCWVQIGLFG